MLVLGINDSSHDSAIALVENGNILFAAHSERYNKEKNTFKVDSSLLEDALSYGTPDIVAYFEKRSKKRLRKAIYGGVNGTYKHLYSKELKCLSGVPEAQLSHHLSHAYAGFLTSPFDDACVVVIDAIGEFETATIWVAEGTSVRKIFSLSYPISFGLFYSAFTRLVGLTPARDEYILMGMSAFGDCDRYYSDVYNTFPNYKTQTLNFHFGTESAFEKPRSFEDKADIAAAVQKVFTERTLEFHKYARSVSGKRNVVYMGGCALNCATNTLLYDIWDDVWIMPNPGDAGSCLGAALGVTKSRAVNFSPYLGHCISGKYPVNLAMDALKTTGVVGVANGRAEFGPRALGNRSLLADPRGAASKISVNLIKKREQFRPFAPVVLEECASEWFDMQATSSPYMQFTYKCKRPDVVPSVVHVDGTSRVQTVNKEQHPGLYSLLTEWKKYSGVPILLNTSLNVKNMPLVNDESDVQAWERQNPGFKIFCADS